MKFTTYINSLHELSIAKDAGVEEIIISAKDLNRFSKLSIMDTNKLLKEAQKLEMTTLLEWDVLYTENEIDNAIISFNEINLECVDRVRVQDLGVMEYIFTNTNKDMELILENGNHNLFGIQTYETYLGERLKKIILSIELNKDKLTEYIKELKTPVEYLGLGRILLFYSPRKLLAPIISGEKEGINYSENSYLEALGESEESPHKGFPIIENTHGTFMFHIKDLFLLDKMSELIQSGLQFLRIDLRFYKDFSLLQKITKAQTDDNIQEVKELYGNKVIRGYYQINKSDVLFKKLKNYRIQRKDESYIGEVIEILKGNYLAIDIKGSTNFDINSHLKLITPEGKELLMKIVSMKDIKYKDITEVDNQKIVLINYMSGVWPKSQVYLN